VRCVICRWVRWSIGREDPIWVEEADTIESEMRFFGLNTDAIFHADPHADRLRELAELGKVDPNEAFTQFLSLAEAGSVWSMIRVGCGYSVGLGTSRNLALAERWLTSAYEHGSDYGLIWSARLAFARGAFSRARTLRVVGVERGLPQAMTDLAWQELKSAKTDARTRARALFENAIGRGYIPAQLELAKAMGLGLFGWREIPVGIKRLFAAAKEFNDLIEARKKRPRMS
jgi:TPR repeat protein